MATSKKKSVASVEAPQKAAAPASSTKPAAVVQSAPQPVTKSSPAPAVSSLSSLASVPTAQLAAPSPLVSADSAPELPVTAAFASQKTSISAAHRHHYVEVAAYYIAERRGFTPGNPVEDWRAAEAEIDRLMASGHFSA